MSPKYLRTLWVACVFISCCILLYYLEQTLNIPTTMESPQIYCLSDTDRPHFVIGILSSNSTADRRKAQRTTWISTLKRLQDQIQFRITYKFLLDLESEDSIQENKIYRDIVYLNVTHHGWAVKFGEKLFIWLKYVNLNFPDALLVSKMDDDVFICVPQMMSRLYELRHPKLYYGWKHPNTISPHMDEMFVVIGSDLVNRIVKRIYCGRPWCVNGNHLIEKEYADMSLFVWLSLYTDVREYADNTKIVHTGNQSEIVIRNDSCVSHLLFHKSLPETMHIIYNKTKLTQEISNFKDVDMLENENLSTISYAPLPGAVSGYIFSGHVVRNKPVPFSPKGYLHIAINDMKHYYDNWAVVTTIFPASNAIKTLSALSNWCLLIVADETTPPEYEYFRNISGKCLKYLSLKEQKRSFRVLSDSIPVNHFGRKNIGYMYAIYHKAKFIWDFDDDNVGIADLKLFDSSNSFVTICNDSWNKLINPYPYFGVNETRTWPRGFPLQHIKDHKTMPTICKLRENVTIGVIQSLANGHPDVDAVYRLTRESPFNFTASIKNHLPLIIPTNSYSPFNAQATMWSIDSFEYLPLPISVNGRVSDIWRSYIAQFFMHKKKIKLAYVQPYVYQVRNPHTLIKDFNAEIDLYQKSKQLVDVLSSSDATNCNTVTDLYENLYRRNFIELSDLRFIKSWEITLSYIRKP